MTLKGCVLAMTGKARSSSNDHRRPHRISVNRSNNCGPELLVRFGECVFEFGQFDEAWRSIGEAMTVIETTKERWFEAEINRIAGEIALMSPEPDAAKAEAYFERRSRSRVNSKQSPGNSAPQ